jgi:hypothetical protein
MYVRIARFEGLDPSRIDEQATAMKQQMAAARSGAMPEGAPTESVKTLMETVKRFLEVVDRESGTSLGIVFCESEDDLRRADAALNAMSPGEGEGRRTAVDMYEVTLDESFA